MCKQLFYVISCVLVLGSAANRAIARLVAYYPLDEGSGSFTADASGNGHHGIIHGTPIWVDSKSVFGKALYFNGVNPSTGWVDAGTWNPSEGTGQLSIALWAQWDGNTDPDGWQGLIGKRQGWTEDGSTMMWCIEIDRDSDTIAFHRGGSYLGTRGYILPVGEWTHIGVSFDGTTGIFYVNGGHVNEGDFSFGTMTNATIAVGCVGGEAGNTFNGILDEVYLYDHALSQHDIQHVMSGDMEFPFAYAPYPVDGSTHAETWVTLSWTSGRGATSHDVYFGENFADVEAGTGDTFQGNQLSTSFLVGLPGSPCPDGLVPGTTYYWRIDEIEANGRTIHRGDVWGFTIMPPGLGEILQEKWNGISGVDLNRLKNHWKYPDNPDETKVITRFDSGTNLDDNYGGRIHGWLYAPFTGDYTFWLCTDDQGELWLSPDGNPGHVELIAYVKDSPTAASGWALPYTWDKYDSQKSKPISLRAGNGCYIMAIWKEGTGWDHCQVAWDGPGIPTQTIIPGSCLSVEPLMVYPSPANGARIGDKTPILSWTHREGDFMYDVYLGTSLDRVTYASTSDTSGIYRGRFRETIYATDELRVDQTYYWRVDNIEADGKTTHKGDVWSFTVVDEVTTDYQVCSSEDDGYASNESLQNLNGNYLKVGASGFAQPPYYICGMVFRNVVIPQGAEVISAHLKIRSYNSRLTDLVYAKIEAEAADSAESFGGFRNMGTLARTSASVNWDHFEPWTEDTWYVSPDIADVIQEIVNRSGWSPTNGSLALLYSTREREGDYRNISAYDRGSDYAPKLEITYTP